MLCPFSLLIVVCSLLHPVILLQIYCTRCVSFLALDLKPLRKKVVAPVTLVQVLHLWTYVVVPVVTIAYRFTSD